MSDMIAKKPAVFRCDACKAVSGLAETMFNLSASDTPDSKRLTLCARDAKDAHKRGFRVFRLAATLRRDTRQEAERRNREVFWNAFNGRKAVDEARRKPAIRIT